MLNYKRVASLAKTEQIGKTELCPVLFLSRLPPVCCRKLFARQHCIAFTQGYEEFCIAWGAILRSKLQAIMSSCWGHTDVVPLGEIWMTFLDIQYSDIIILK